METYIVCIKASFLDCCIIPDDAGPPLGVFGTMPSFQNVQNSHVHGSLLWNMTEIFCKNNLSFKNYLKPISKLWNHSWCTDIGDFIVHWSENTPFVTIWIMLWITAFYKEKAKVFCITLQHLKEFNHLNKLHSSQWKFICQFVEQDYAKTEVVGRFDTYESF